ncbi:MAG: HAD-IC family P-type ATPase [Patescibacteria group bacterium]|nr:HAD-IC family P-type ATPase [Patescibacteria group bacterium]
MKEFHNLSVEEVIKFFKTSASGLSFEEAEKRTKKYGLNKLPEPKRLTKLTIFLSQFKNPLIIVLIVAVGICFFLKDLKNLSVILVAVVLNTFIGYWQEEKSERAVHQLRKMVEHKAKVVRNGEEHLISAEKLVPGDILILEAGDIVLADARVIESHNLQTMEAVLTGESKPSNKKIEVLSKDTILADRENMVYQGTIISRGKGKALVIATGFQTEFGKIASLIKETREDETPLQRKMTHLAKVIGSVIVILVICLFILGLTTRRKGEEMLLTSVALAVAGVPEGLVIAITVCLATGMQRILKKKALVRKLIAAETLGSVTTICSDKTGTLTEGKMSLSEIINFDKNNDLIFKIGLLCNSLIVENPEDQIENWLIEGDETEKSLVLAIINKEGVNKWKNLHQECPRLSEIPFDSERMWMATLHRCQMSNAKYQNFIFVKGAPEKILSLSNFLERGNQREEVLTKTKREEIENKYLKLTEEGLRVLAIAYKPTDSKELKINDVNNLILVGLVALKDPLRAEARATIMECQEAGIRPVIVTGDHRLTAQSIAQEIGLANKEILEGRDLDRLDDDQLTQKLNEVSVFARVEPKHKIRIVDLLQKKKEVVAMTGDGVNDAPAIKSADIGIALGSGTDVTKETADLVLLDNNFKTIVEAIKEGRGIFDNIKKVVLYLLCNSFTEIILVAGSLLAGLPLPILPGQILWINIVQDGPPAMALTYEKTSPEVMKERPRGLKVPILDRQTKFLIFGVSMFFNLILFNFFLYFWYKTKDLAYTQTMMFVAVGLTTMFYVFACKNLKKNIWQYNPFDNPFLNLSVVFGFLMFLLALYIPFFQNFLQTVPLRFIDWSILGGLSLINLLLIEFGKWLFRPKRN